MHRTEWNPVPIKALYRRRDLTGRPDLPLLSVYRDLGVVPRDGRDDNYNRAGEDLGAYRVVRPGDLVLNKMKTWQGSLGISSYEGIVSPAYFVCEQVGLKVDRRFVHHLLRSQPFIAEYARRSKGIRPAQWDLPWDEFRDIRVALPPTARQRAIADFLDCETARIDSLTAKKHRLLEVLTEKFHSLVDYSIADGRSTSVRRVVSLITSGPRGWSDRVGEEGLPFIRSANLQRDSLDLRTDNLQRVTEVTTAEGSRSTAKSGDILIGITGANTGWVGLVGRDHSPGYVSQHVALLRPNESVLSEWLAWSLYGRRVQGQLAAGQYGGTKQQLGLEDLAEVSIFVPPRDRQLHLIERVRIAEKRQLQIARRLTRQIGLLKERRQALITAAVTGELEIPEGVAG